MGVVSLLPLIRHHQQHLSTWLPLPTTMRRSPESSQKPKVSPPSPLDYRLERPACCREQADLIRSCPSTIAGSLAKIEIDRLFAERLQIALQGRDPTALSWTAETVFGAVGLANIKVSREAFTRPRQQLSATSIAAADPRSIFIYSALTRMGFTQVVSLLSSRKGR